MMRFSDRVEREPSIPSHQVGKELGLVHRYDVKVLQVVVEQWKQPVAGEAGKPIPGVGADVSISIPCVDSACKQS